MAVSTGDHAASCQSQGRIFEYRDELGLQLGCRGGHSNLTRTHSMAPVSHACSVLLVVLHYSLFLLPRDDGCELGGEQSVGARAIWAPTVDV